MMQIQRVIAAALLLLLLLVQSLYAAESKETKSVLVLYSEDKAHPAHELTERGIQSGLPVEQALRCPAVYRVLDVSRFSSPTHTRALVDYLRRKYADSKIDAIIAVYEAAVNLLLGEAARCVPRGAHCRLCGEQILRRESGPIPVAKFCHRRSHRGQHSRSGR